MCRSYFAVAIGFLQLLAEGYLEAVVTLTPRERIVRPGVCCDDVGDSACPGRVAR